MEVIQTIPIVPVFDVAKAREFCLDYLGLGLSREARDSVRFKGGTK